MDATDHTTEGGPEAPSARPSLDAVLALEPDWEDATLWALQAGTAEPLPRLRAAQDAADADTARHIAEALPAGGPARRRALARLDADGCARYVVTDVHRDGTLTGPNLQLLRDVCARTDAPVVASGGVSSLDDLRAIGSLVELGVEGSIVGKALYEGRIQYPRTP